MTVPPLPSFRMRSNGLWTAAVLTFVVLMVSMEVTGVAPEMAPG